MGEGPFLIKSKALLKTEILLQGLDFQAFHGVYPEEKLLGNRFRVDLKIQVEVPFNPLNEDLGNTVDYAIVYNLVKREMENPCKLLETLGQRICNSVAVEFPSVLSIETSISKANPAIGGLCNWVTVTTHWTKF